MINNPNSIPTKEKKKDSTLSATEFLRQKKKKSQSQDISAAEFLKRKKQSSTVSNQTPKVTTEVEDETTVEQKEKPESRSRNPIVNFGETFWNVASKQIPGTLKAGASALYEGPAGLALKFDEYLRQPLMGEGTDEFQKKFQEAQKVRGEKGDETRTNLLTSGMEDMQEFQEAQEGAVTQTTQINDGIDLVNYISNSIAQAGAQIPASLLTMGGTSVGQEIGIIYMDQVEKIAKENDITPEKVIEQGLDDRASAAAYGAFAGSLDALGAKGATKFIPKKKLRNGLARRALSFLQSAGVEGTTEGSQSIIEQFGASRGAGDSVMESITGVNLREAYEEGMAGAVGGSGVNVATQVQDAVRKRIGGTQDSDQKTPGTEQEVQQEQTTEQPSEVPSAKEFLENKRKQKQSESANPSVDANVEQGIQVETPVDPAADINTTEDSESVQGTPEEESNIQQNEQSESKPVSNSTLDMDNVSSISQSRQEPPSPYLPQGDLFSDGFTDIDDSYLDAVRVKVEDQYLDLKRYQEQAEQKNGKLPDEMNPYQEEELFTGRVEHNIEEFKREFEEPIIKQISDMGWTIEDAEQYLMARHAKERNDQIASINPELPDGGSGMSNQKAADILKQVNAGDKSAQAQELGQMWDQMTKFQRDLLLNSGLADEQTIRNWENTYKHYVNLKSGGKSSSRQNKGSGFDVLGKFKQATGRTSLAENAIANTLSEIRTDLVRSEKVKVGESLLKFVKEHPNPDLWEVDKVEYQPTINPKTGLVDYKTDPRYKLADNVLNVRVNGENHHITFHSDRGKRLAKSLKNLGAENSGVLLKWLNKTTRSLALINTGLNPEFVLTNFLRDVQTAGVNLSSTEAENLTKQITKDVFKARRGMMDYLNGNFDSEWAKHADNFVRTGGKTGWIDAYKSVEVFQKSLDTELKRMDRKKGDPRELLRKSFDYIQKLNDSVENAIRLSAFKHVRENGLTDKQAASLAKNLTVNFNRKGQWGPMLNALYMFYGASMNGTMRIFQALKSPKTRKMVGNLLAGSVILDVINRISGGEDDDEVPYYDKIPQWVKERNLVIMLPGTEGEYITIPSPYGYNVLNVTGMELGKAISSNLFGNPVRYNPSESAINVGSALLDSFNPVGTGGSVNQAISPTVLDPFLQTGENIDWTGRNIKPPINPYDRSPKPESQNYYGSAPGWAKKVAKQVNELTGGSNAVPGALDFSPNYYDHWFRFVTGGVGNFVAEAFGTSKKLVTQEEIESHEVPFWGKLKGEVNEASTYSMFNEYMQEIEYALEDLEDAKSLGNEQRIKEIQTEKQALLNNVNQAKKIEQRISKLIQKRNKAEESDASYKEKREIVNEINDAISGLQKSLIKSVNESFEAE